MSPNRTIELVGKNGAGLSCLVSEADYEALAVFRWYATSATHTHRYAFRFECTALGKRCMISMHRQIVGAKVGEFVDHINGDTFDNRRDNLRIASAWGNSTNRRKAREGSSRFKGVSWDSRAGKWRAGIKAGGKNVSIGTFDDEVVAAHAYDAAARAAFGAFAWLNFSAVSA